MYRIYIHMPYLNNINLVLYKIPIHSHDFVVGPIAKQFV